MSIQTLRHLTTAEATELARSAPASTCTHCRPFASTGWTSFPATGNAETLEALGALWLADQEEPTLEETPRPTGADQWSADAPISLVHHPYNRCEIWACRHCRLPFLRYTEYGGYYVDPRIRELHGHRLLG